MHKVFLFGTLRHLPLLEIVAGSAVKTEPATLLDYVAVFAHGHDFPVLTARKGAQQVGLVVTLDDVQRARLDYYEGPFGYTLCDVSVETDGGVVAAAAYFPPAGRFQSGEDWDLGNWQAKWGSIVTRAAIEVMAAYGTKSAKDIDARTDIILARAQAYENTAAWTRPRSMGRDMGRDGVSVTGQTYDHLGFFTLETLMLRHARFDGGPDLDIKRAVFRAGEAVTVLPYDPARDRVLLIEQFRAAPYAQGDPEPWLIEPIAGIVDAGETVETAAHREAHEEAGIAFKELRFVSRYYPSPGATAQVLHSYVGLADLPDGIATVGGLSDEGEDIAVHVVSFEHAMAMLESGEAAVAPLVISLQWLAANRDGLRLAL